MATIHPAPNFNTAQEAHRLRNEMKGFGTDEQAIMNILLSLSNQQRITTIKFFQSEMDRDLVEDLMCELGSTYEDLAACLLYTPVEYTLRQLNNRLERLVDFDDLDLVELVCTKNKEEMKQIMKRYRSLFHKKLSDHLTSDTTSPTRILLAKMLDGVYDDDLTPEQAIEHEPNKSAIMECLTKPVTFLANRLHKAFSMTSPARERIIIRIIATRCEIDLKDIEAEFERISKRTLLKAVETDINGDFKKALCTLIGTP